jgi:hypothetical protein
MYEQEFAVLILVLDETSWWYWADKKHGDEANQPRPDGKQKEQPFGIVG